MCYTPTRAVSKRPRTQKAILRATAEQFHINQPTQIIHHAARRGAAALGRIQRQAREALLRSSNAHCGSHRRAEQGRNHQVEQ